MRFVLLLLLSCVAALAVPMSAGASDVCVTQPWGASEAAEADCEATEPNCSLPEVTDAERGPMGPRCLFPSAECGPDTRHTQPTRSASLLAFAWPDPLMLPTRGVGLLPGPEPLGFTVRPLERTTPPTSPPPRGEAGA